MFRIPDLNCFGRVCDGSASRGAEKTVSATSDVAGLASPLEREGVVGISPVWARRSVISPRTRSDQSPGPGSAGLEEEAADESDDSGEDGASEETPCGCGAESRGECVCGQVVRTMEAPPPPSYQRGNPRASPMKRASSTSSLASECSVEAFEEDAKTLARAARPRVLFSPSKNTVVEIPHLDDYGWRCRRACYWQAEEYAAMSASRLRLERAVLETGGRVPIPGESRRGLGLVCEPETRIARAHKIQATSRAVLRMHAEGASASKLARFAADASAWATRNALVCAAKDIEAVRLDAASEPSSAMFSSGFLPSPTPPFGYDALGAAGRDNMKRCDSNTASTDGLASMIRNDSLANLHAGRLGVRA